MLHGRLQTFFFSSSFAVSLSAGSLLCPQVFCSALFFIFFLCFFYLPIFFLLKLFSSLATFFSSCFSFLFFFSSLVYSTVFSYHFISIFPRFSPFVLITFLRVLHLTNLFFLWCLYNNIPTFERYSDLLIHVFYLT